MEKERKTLLNKMVKLVKKEGIYHLAYNHFTDEEIEYLGSFGIKVTPVNTIRKGLLGDYDVTEYGAILEMVGE